MTGTKRFLSTAGTSDVTIDVRHEAVVVCLGGLDRASSIELSGQIVDSVSETAVVLQAIGMLTQYFGASVDDATEMLRLLALNRNEPLPVTAGLLVDGTIHPAIASQNDPFALLDKNTTSRSTEARRDHGS